VRARARSTAGASDVHVSECVRTVKGDKKDDPLRRVGDVGESGEGGERTGRWSARWKD
jgi:hypothetical protein